MQSLIPKINALSIRPQGPSRVRHRVRGPTPCAQLGSARRLAWPWRDRQACLQRPACFWVLAAASVHSQQDSRLHRVLGWAGRPVFAGPQFLFYVNAPWSDISPQDLQHAPDLGGAPSVRRVGPGPGPLSTQLHMQTLPSTPRIFCSQASCA